MISVGTAMQLIDLSCFGDPREANFETIRKFVGSDAVLNYIILLLSYLCELTMYVIIWCSICVLIKQIHIVKLILFTVLNVSIICLYKLIVNIIYKCAL